MSALIRGRCPVCSKLGQVVIGSLGYDTQFDHGLDAILVVDAPTATSYTVGRVYVPDEHVLCFEQLAPGRHDWLMSRPSPMAIIGTAYRYGRFDYDMLPARDAADGIAIAICQVDTPEGSKVSASMRSIHRADGTISTQLFSTRFKAQAGMGPDDEIIWDDYRSRRGPLTGHAGYRSYGIQLDDVWYKDRFIHEVAELMNWPRRGSR